MSHQATQPTASGAPAHMPHAHPYAAPQEQAFAFPTTSGVQVLQPASSRVVGYRWRVRWENIVPAVAVIAFIVAGITFADTMRERDATMRQERSLGLAGSGSGSKSSSDDEGSMSRSEVMEKVSEARRLMDAGDFKGAMAVLHPLLDHTDDFAEIGRLHEELEKRTKAYEALVVRAGQQIKAYRFDAALVTLAALADIAPLTPELERQQAAAKEGLLVNRIIRRATRLANQGLKGQALKMVKDGYAKYKDPRLLTLARKFAAVTPVNPRKQAIRGASGAAAPPAGSGNSSKPSSPPPTTSSGGGPPRPPSVPNTGAGGNVAGHAGHNH